MACGVGVTDRVAVEVAEEVAITVEVGVRVARPIVIVAPLTGKPLKSTGSPFVPVPAVTLN